MERRAIVARILRVEGFLLLVVAGIHMAAIPVLRYAFASALPEEGFQFVFPPFLLDHIVAGILLVPLGVSTIYSASGIRQGQRWAWMIGTINAVAVLTLPIVLVVVMDPAYFHATPFLIASILITLVGLSMLWPLLWARREFPPR